VRSISLRLYNFIWKTIDWVFPPACVNCGKVGYSICPNCKQTISYINPPICLKCGIPGNYSRICNSCMKNKPAFDKLRAVAIYSGPIKKAIQANKFKKDISVGIELSKLIAVYIRNENFDLGEIVPIPLGVKRLKERGYNQVSSFAFPLSLNFGVRYSP